MHDRAFNLPLFINSTLQNSVHGNATPCVRNMNDNKPTWTSIGFEAALILSRLRNEAFIQRHLFGSQISGSSFISVAEAPETDSLRALSNEGLERAIPPMIASSSNAVTSVKSSASLSEIDDPIIRANAIDMVDLLVGPATVNVKPSQTVSEKYPPINPDEDVAGFRCASCDSPDCAATGGNSANKMPCLWLISEQLSDAFDSCRYGVFLRHIFNSVQLAAVTRNVLWFLQIKDDIETQVDRTEDKTERKNAGDDPASRREVLIFRRSCGARE